MKAERVEVGPGLASFCGFDLTFDQPVDHKNPEGPHFQQRAKLLQRKKGFAGPVSLMSSGYGLFHDAFFDSEIAAGIGANSLVVEHRYFDESAPDPIDWQYLTIEQAAGDHHRVVEALKPLYAGPWIAEGGSKGGMTSVYHRRFYPDDVAATLAYVAPQIDGVLDERFGPFLDQVSNNQNCRTKLVALEREALGSPRRERLVDLMVAAGAAEGRTFDFFGPDKAFEFAMVEFRFFFWQYQPPSRCNMLPAVTASDKVLYDFFKSVVHFTDSFDDASLEAFAPFYFQLSTELGGVAPTEAHVEDLLRYPGGDVITAYPPAGVPKPFDPSAMAEVGEWLANEAENVMFIYGEFDPWTAAAVPPPTRPEVLRFIAPGANHGAEISDLTDADHEAAFDAIERWTGIRPKVANPGDPLVPGVEKLPRRPVRR